MKKGSGVRVSLDEDDAVRAKDEGGCHAEDLGCGGGVT